MEKLLTDCKEYLSQLYCNEKEERDKNVIFV